MTRGRPCLCQNVVSAPSSCPSGVTFTETVECKVLGNGMAEEEGTQQDFMIETGPDKEVVTIVEVDVEESPVNVTVGGNTTQVKPFCGWKWSKWSTCTQSCGLSPTGNTTRNQQCWCLGMDTPHENETMCLEDHPKWTETVPCNAFPCSGVRPQNKLVWQELYQSDQNNPINQQIWPIPGTQKFNCSRGNQFNNKTWAEILQDKPYEDNLAWYFLAKEYIAGRLNKANGCTASSEVIQALEEAQYLLSKCDGYTSEENYQAYLTKEKLSRANNGIGGLPDVDAEMSLSYGGGGTGSEDEGPLVILTSAHTTLLVMVLLLVLMGIGIFVVYRLRLRNLEVLENEKYSYSSDESQEEERGVEVI